MARRRYRKRYRKRGGKKRVNKVVRTVMKKMGGRPELKVGLRGAATSNIDSTNGTLFQFVVPVAGGFLDRGVERNQRIGDRVQVRSIKTLCQIHYRTGVDQANWANVRVIMIYDREPNGLLWTVEEMFGLPAAAGQTHNYSMNPYTHQSEKRFRTLYDKVHYLDLGFNSGQGNTNSGLKTIRIHKTFKNPLNVQYNRTATAGTVADIESGAIYLYFIQSGPALVSVTSVSGLNWQIGFQDT